MGVLAMLRRNPHERAGYLLYGAAVAAARAPYFYQSPAAGGLGVPDTLDGRFDLVGLHVFLVIRRLGAAAPKLAQAVFDAMFNDMDVNLREMGVGDLSVGKKVKVMWEAFHGRSTVYQAALQADDADGLAKALARNVWRGDAPAGAAATLARLARVQDAHLAAQPVSALEAGRVSFAPVAAP
jgi:cytochrome b pre-mRNA-processing protein 3